VTDAAALLVDSLGRRVRTMHSLYYQAIESMELEHVNHVERKGVLPIAFSLFHAANIEDTSYMWLTSATPIWNEEWQQRVAMSINDDGKERTVDEMTSQQIGDYDAFKTYQRAVYERTEAYLDTVTLDELSRVLITRPFPEKVASTFSARCAGPEGIRVLDGFECWIYQHGLRHMGEIELARALVGLGGMTS
jgi:hypothetical protein